MSAPGCLFRVGIATSTAQFILDEVTGIEPVDLPAQAPRSVLPCFLIQTQSGERLWLPNMPPFDLSGAFQLSERLAPTTSDGGDSFLLGANRFNGVVLVCNQLWLPHPSNELEQPKGFGAVACRPLSMVVRLIVHLLHCQLAQANARTHSPVRSTLVQAVTKLIGSLKNCQKVRRVNLA